MTAVSHWRTSRFLVPLDRPQVMAIVNVTPDSFSDGGQHSDVRAALAHCERVLAEGADMLDIGGESTRPGSPPVPLADELARVLPVLREAVQLGVPVSVDTYKAEVMQAALDLGADIVNDVWALRQPGAAAVVAAHPSCGVCLMHMHRDPQTMQTAPMAGEVLVPVARFLDECAQALQALGVAADRICIDPGIGFGKTVAQNFSLLQQQATLAALGYPLLAGWSRKSSLGAVTGRTEPQQRAAASVAAAVLAVQRGAHVVRVHDVRDTVDALRVWAACERPHALPG
jgi:dihydropteroate synthase